MACVRWTLMGLIFLAVVGVGASLIAIFLLIAALWWLAGGMTRRTATSRTHSYRSENVHQLRDRVANDLLDLEDPTRFANAETRERFRRAGDLYLRASDQLDYRRSRRRHAEAHANLRRARFELGAIRTDIEGRPTPRRTRPLRLVWVGPSPRWWRASCNRW